MDPTHLPPGIMDAIKSLPLYVLAGIALWKAFAATRVLVAAAKSIVLRSEREASTHDHVHGRDAKGEPAHIPFDPAQPGLLTRMVQAEDAAHANARELALHRTKLCLPDPNDEEEVQKYLAEHVSTGSWPAIEEHRARVRSSGPEHQELPAHRPRPDGGYRGGGGPAE